MQTPFCAIMRSWTLFAAFGGSYAPDVMQVIIILKKYYYFSMYIYIYIYIYIIAEIDQTEISESSLFVTLRNLEACNPVLRSQARSTLQVFEM